MRIFNKVIGILLVLVGLYFLGQNIIFTTETSPYFWKDISAAASVLAIALGIIALIFFKRETGWTGGLFIVFGIILAFISGGLIVKPTSLWTFTVSLLALLAGFQLIRVGGLRF